MKTTEKGDLGRGLVIADLLRRGHKVSMPLSEDVRYDLVLDRDGVLLKVQCKAGEPKNGRLVVKCRSTSSWYGKTRSTHKYTKDDIDILAAVDLDAAKVYYISSELLGRGKSEIALRLMPARNGQTKNVWWAKDYADLP